MKHLISVILLAFSMSTFADTAPSEFITQTLEPTGGKIVMPKDWFYKEAHRGSGYMWTLSREDGSKSNGSYTTGVRIQTFTGVKNGTGKTAKQFMLDYASALKKKAAKVITSCDESDQGLFTRICLETEEGPYRIRYALYWGTSGMNMAITLTAGTTKELWDTYAPAFDKMGTFEFIDMKRFENK